MNKKEILYQKERAEKECEREDGINPLSNFSTTELKKELRRRKSK